MAREEPGLGTKTTKAIRNVWARYVFQDLRDRDLKPDAALREAGLTKLALADEGWLLDKGVAHHPHPHVGATIP